MTSQFNKGQPRKLDDWGALVALAWGAGRALDYFETDKAVDAKRVGLEGALTLGQGDAGDDGVRSTVRDRLRQLIGAERREAAPPLVRRDDREHRGRERISLDGGQLSQVRRTLGHTAGWILTS